MRLKKYAVTLSNETIVYPMATSEVAAKQKVESLIAKKGLSLTVKSVRVV
ncbi:hypothetical protein ABZ714_14295 [Streptomyces sp. NPDC006798]